MAALAGEAVARSTMLAASLQQQHRSFPASTSPSQPSSSSSLSGLSLFSSRQARGVVLANRPTGGRRGSRVLAQSSETQEQSATALSGVVFEPFTEVQSKLQAVPAQSDKSYARQRFSVACEAALNEQINVEYNVSYIYHALFAYFDRDNVALPGFASYFRHASEEEREHAEALMRYQNLRGGRVKLQSIMMPEMEFDHSEKGEALYAMELALSLEKLNNEKLLALHKTAEESGDVQMTDFVEGTFLADQVQAIKNVSEFVSRLRRVGKGHGVYHFDVELLQKFPAAP